MEFHTIGQSILYRMLFTSTIHKTQSPTLDAVSICLDRSIFSTGHAYTALSCARRIEDISISHLDRAAFIVDRAAVKECERLEAVWKDYQTVMETYQYLNVFTIYTLLFL